MKAKIAVIFFPGNNREEETKTAVEAAGMQADIVRWNDERDITEYDGYVIPGGFSYEDRIRAGVISSKDPIMKIIFEESKKGKPVLGICNGAQILIETKMVPGIHNKLEMALAPNINPFMQGFRSKWVELSMNTSKKTAFNRSFEKGEKIRMPIAHAEGRFITKDNGLLETIRKEGLIVFKYSSSSPNSSVEDAAAICNLEGNVMSMMPHPECGSFFRQEPEFSGKLEENEKTSATNKIFQSMRSYIEENKEKWQK